MAKRRNRTKKPNAIDKQLEVWEAEGKAEWEAMQREMKRNLIDDFEMAKRALFYDPFSLQYFSERLLADSNLMFLALRKNGRALQFAPEWMKDSKRWAGYALPINISAIRFVSERLKNDAEWLAGYCYSPSRTKYILAAVVKKEVQEKILELSKGQRREWLAWKYTKKWRTPKSSRETLNEMWRQVLGIRKGGRGKWYSRVTRRRHRHH